jgi:hypothetical protein
MKLSQGQQNMFWSAFAPAWKAHCESVAGDPADRAAQDAWRHTIIREETGCRSLGDVGRSPALDRLLKRLAVEAGNYARAADLEVAGAERIRHRSADCARQICEIDGRADLGTEEDRWRYVAGVAAQAWRGRAWLDIVEADLDSVFMMLDTYRRKLLRRAGWRGGRQYPNEPLGFELGRRFGRDGRRVVLLDDSVCSGQQSGTQESRKGRQEVCA